MHVKFKINSYLHWTSTMKSILCLAILFTCGFNLASGNIKEKVVLCYYGSWAAYRQGYGRFEVSNIPVNLCTHAVYTFMDLDHTGNVISFDPFLDYNENYGKGYLIKFNALKRKNPKLKTILAVGGFNVGSKKFSEMAADLHLRKNFITSALIMVTKYGFNGLEIDWLYPNGGNTVNGPKDVNNFVILLKEMSEEFKKKGLLLTASVEPNGLFAKSYYKNVPLISSYLDYVNIMGYNLNGPWNKKTGHNAPLYKGEGTEHIKDSEYASIEYALKYWLKQGCPPEKLVLGVPLYGRTFILKDARLNYVGAPIIGEGISGPYTKIPGILGYNELCLALLTKPWFVYRDELAKVPYAVKGKNWVSYDDAKSIAAKVEYGVHLGIAGVMVWGIETDDFLGYCGLGKFPLLRSVNEALGKCKCMIQEYQ